MLFLFGGRILIVQFFGGRILTVQIFFDEQFNFELHTCTCMYIQHRLFKYLKKKKKEIKYMLKRKWLWMSSMEEIYPASRNTAC